MCGRYALTIDQQMELEDFLNAIDKGIVPKNFGSGDKYFASFNATPTSVMPVCYADENNNRFIESMYWWYMKWLPENGKPDFRYATFNSRDDKLLSSSLWGKEFKEGHNRCLVPMDGFFEFTGPKGNKTVHYFHPTEDSFWAAAGIYSEVSPNPGIKSYSIITTSANAVVDGIHDRMPVFLHPEEFDDWLNPNHSTDFIMDMLDSYPSDAMTKYIASPAVSNARNNFPELLQKSTLF